MNTLLHNIIFMRFKNILLSLIALSLLSACGNKSPIPSAGYRTARAQSNLELPPDLVNSTSASLKQAYDDADPALAPVEGVVLRSSGEKRWLDITANASDTWAKLIDYFNKSGMPILVENKRDGILETDWIGDNESDSYSASLVRSKLGNLFGRAPVNDKFTVWMEKIDEQITAVHVTHKQLKQFVIDPQGQRQHQIESGWVESTGDGFKEVELLRDMAAYFGGAIIETENTARVVLVQSAPPHIVLAEGTGVAWELLERAIITSASYTLIDFDPETNNFRISESKAPSFWNSVKLKDKYNVHLEPFGDTGKTRISITDKKGEASIDRNDALPVLWALVGELRRMETEE
jgi:uncharacterized lipoprotein